MGESGTLDVSSFLVLTCVGQGHRLVGRILTIGQVSLSRGWWRSPLSCARLWGVSQLSRTGTSGTHQAQFGARVISEPLAPSFKIIENEKNKGWRRGEIHVTVL